MSALPARDLWQLLRQRMVAHLQAMGITQPRVLAAMQEVPRHLFVPEDEQAIAYADRAMPIGEGQTISQPYVVARMAELLDLHAGMRVLDVGTGSGYAAAVHSRLVERVISIERIHTLAELARARLVELHYDNVLVVEGDGTRGYPPEAPYQAIGVAAATPEVPQALLDQLADGGHLVIPLGTPTHQQLVRITRHGEKYLHEAIGEVAFVPLVSDEGHEGE